jgi:hypothetical protein
VPYVRTVKTKSGATAEQIVWSSQRGSRAIEHLGSAHDEAGLETLKAAARQRIVAGQAELDLGLEPAVGGPPPITSSRMGCLLDALERAYQVLRGTVDRASMWVGSAYTWTDYAHLPRYGGNTRAPARRSAPTAREPRTCLVLPVRGSLAARVSAGSARLCDR